MLFIAPSPETLLSQPTWRDVAMSSITDEYMDEVLKTRKPYTLVIFKGGPRADGPGADRLIREHGRRNLKLRKEGVLNLIIALKDEGEIWGLDVFNTGVDETRKIMEGDPAVKAGVMKCEIHPAVSFPGDSLSG
jgi:hypothetical protein